MRSGWRERRRAQNFLDIGGMKMITVIYMISGLGIASAVLCVCCLRSSAQRDHAAEKILKDKAGGEGET